MVEEYFSFDFQDSRGVATFASHSELSTFSQDIANEYSWLKTIRNNPIFDELYVHINKEITELIHFIKMFQQKQISKDQLKQRFKSTFIEKKLPTKGNKYYDLVQSMRERELLISDPNEITTEFKSNIIAAYMLSDIIMGTSLQKTIAATKLAHFEMGLDKEEFPVIQRIYDNAINKFNANIKKLDLEAITKLEALETQRVDNQKAHEALHKTLNEQFVENTCKHEDEVQAKIAELNQVKETYTELMRLKAPVEYWEKKADKHKDNAKAHMTRLIWVGSCAGIILAAIYGVAICLAFKFVKADTSLGALASSASFLLISTTLYFWVCRFIIKLYLSEHHLGIDADERAIMVQTYLALTHEGKIEKEERGLILTPLFRPSSDGIVKDDTSLDLGIASLLSKAASNSK